MSRNATLGAFLGVLIVSWFCYSAAFDSVFQLDDEVNLGGLAKVNDSESFTDSSFREHRGRPVGRCHSGRSHCRPIPGVMVPRRS